jgi:predicted ABC-type sugar transport system permease subunit
LGLTFESLKELGVHKWIRGENFLNFHGTRRINSRRFFKKLGGGEFLGVFFLCDFSWEGEEKYEEFW